MGKNGLKHYERLFWASIYLALTLIILGLLTGCATQTGEYIARCHEERVHFGGLMLRTDKKCTAPAGLFYVFDGEEGIQPIEDYVEMFRLRPDDAASSQEQ